MKKPGIQESLMFTVNIKDSLVKSIKMPKIGKLVQMKPGSLMHKYASKHHYTVEEINFLKDNISGRSCAELTNIFNEHFCSAGKDKFKPAQIRKIMAKNGIRNDKLLRHVFTSEEIQFLERIVPGHSHEEIRRLFNEQFETSLVPYQINSKISDMGLHNGLRCHSIPPLPREHYPVGKEFVDNRGYANVKIASPSVWKRKHIVIWEEAHGPVPEGHAIMFADGNKQNFSLDNLLMVSKTELGMMNRHSLIFNDKDLTKAGKAIADLIIVIGKRKKQLKEKKGKPGPESKAPHKMIGESKHENRQ